MANKTEVKTFEISVDGFAGVPYCARSLGQARAAAWRDYLSYRTVTFAQFMKISKGKRIENAPGVGDRIRVSGEMVSCVAHPNSGSNVAFMRDGEDRICFSHPLDVEYGPFTDETSTPTPELDAAPAMAM